MATWKCHEHANERQYETHIYGALEQYYYGHCKSCDWFVSCGDATLEPGICLDCSVSMKYPGKRFCMRCTSNLEAHSIYDLPVVVLVERLVHQPVKSARNVQ